MCMKKCYLRSLVKRSSKVLLNRRIVHSTFKLPLKKQDSIYSSIMNIDSPAIISLRDVDIIWAEAPMTSEQALNAVDVLL